MCLHTEELSTFIKPLHMYKISLTLAVLLRCGNSAERSMPAMRMHTCCVKQTPISITWMEYIQSVWFIISNFGHHSDVIIGAMASQISSLTIVYSTVYAGAYKTTPNLRVTGICAGNSPVNSRHKWPVTAKMFPFDDVITVMVAIIGRCGYIQYRVQFMLFVRWK